MLTTFLLSSSKSVASPAWSAALRFAPRKNVQNNKARRPPPSVLISSGFSVAPALGEDDLSASPVEKTEEIPPKTAIASSSTSWPLEIKPGSATKEDIKTDALRTETGPRESTAISLPKITAPPELFIPSDELEKDRALFAACAQSRGEKRPSAQQWNPGWQEDGEDEDVNGFGNTSAGRKAKKKVSSDTVLSETGA